MAVAHSYCYELVEYANSAGEAWVSVTKPNVDPSPSAL